MTSRVSLMNSRKHKAESEPAWTKDFSWVYAKLTVFPAFFILAIGGLFSGNIRYVVPSLMLLGLLALAVFKPKTLDKLLSPKRRRRPSNRLAFWANEILVVVACSLTASFVAICDIMILRDSFYTARNYQVCLELDKIGISLTGPIDSRYFCHAAVQDAELLGDQEALSTFKKLAEEADARKARLSR